MKVSIVRSGGFAGLVSRLGALDTADLSADAADEVAGAVRQVAAAPPQVGADMMLYTVTVSDEEGERRYTVPDPVTAGLSAEGEGRDEATAAAASGLEVLLRHCGSGGARS